MAAVSSRGRLLRASVEAGQDGPQWPAVEPLEPRLLLSALDVTGPLAAVFVPSTDLAGTSHLIGPTPPPERSLLLEEQGRLPSTGAVFVPHADLTDYDWWYGCSPTTGGLHAAWWDQEVALWDPDYTVFPGDPDNWLFDRYPSSNPNDFLVPDHANGVVNGYAHSVNDTWQGHLPDSIGDFMLTVNGGSYDNNIVWGMRNFMAYDDPRTSQNESWNVTTWTDWAPSFTFEDYKAEIDAGRPVHLWLYSPGGGHSVLGTGYYDPDGPGGQEWIEVYTTWNWGVREWEWTNETESGYGFTVGGAMMMDVLPRSTDLTGYLALQHTSVDNLVINIGLGDPANPAWETGIWSGSGGGNINLVLTDIDLSAARPFLPVSSDWYLEVYDAAGGNQGTIMDFQIRDGDLRWFTSDTGVPILDLQTQYAYIMDGTDLRGDSLSAGPDRLSLVSITQAGFELSAIGTQNAGPFEVAFFWSDFEVLVNGDDIPALLDIGDPNYDPLAPNVYHVAGLLAGDTLSDTVNLAVPSNDPFGTDGQYFLGMWTDVDDTVAETQEGNNHGRGVGLDLAQVSWPARTQAAVSGHKWFDTDLDGQWDADEPALSGWTIYLDLDEDGQFDEGVEPYRITPADGSYAFTQLPAGTYVVGEVLRPSWQQTYPYAPTIDYILDDGTRENSVGLGAGGDMMWINRFTAQSGGELITSISVAWGNTTAGQSCTVLLYDDPNEDGDPIDAVLLTSAATAITNPSSNVFASVPITPTVVSGSFFVAALTTHVSGDYPAAIDQTTYQGQSWVTGTTTPGGFDVTDLSANAILPTTTGNIGLPGNWLLRAAAGGNAGSWTVLVDADELVPDVDFGNFGGGTIRAFKYYDANQNGQQDGAEGPLEGWRIYLDLNSSGQWDQGEPFGITALDGYCQFKAAPGTYILAEEAQGDWLQTDGGGLVQVVLGQTLNVQFGNYAPTEIRGSKWSDLNSNGSWDAGEPGMQGWTIYLDLNENGLFDAGLEPSQLTRPDGSYEFTHLLPGSYSVGEVLQAGWTQTWPVGAAYQAAAVTYGFEDISSTGSPILVNADDGYTGLANLAGFAFTLYGVTYTSVYINSNGLITFGSGTTAFSNSDLLSTPSQAGIAVFWDDLVIEGGTNSAVYWKVLGSGDDQRLVIQWNDVRFFGGTAMGQITFQAVLWEKDGAIQLNYPDLASLHPGAEGGYATVGIKAAGTNVERLLLCYNNGPNAYVGTGKSTRITAVGQVAYTVDLAAGDVVENIRFGSYIPLDMEVRGNDAIIADGDASPSVQDRTDFREVALAGATRDRAFTVANLGANDLHLTGTPRVSISGPQASDFTVITQPAATLAGGATSNFVIRFDPSALGLRQANVTIANDDPDEAPYNFAIRGEGWAWGGGDANKDHVVDVGDLGILAFNWGKPNRTWSQADFTGDGEVNVGDLGVLAFNWSDGMGQTAAPAAGEPAVAEPLTVAPLTTEPAATEDVLASAVGSNVSTRYLGAANRPWLAAARLSRGVGRLSDRTALYSQVRMPRRLLLDPDQAQSADDLLDILALL